MDSLSCGMPARFQKSDEITVNNPHSTPAIGHVQREIAVSHGVLAGVSQARSARAIQKTAFSYSAISTPSPHGGFNFCHISRKLCAT
jgi:hypothetical protein